MTIAEDSKVSPMMAQWHACKRSAPGALLLFRLGDFYEAFYEDAVTLSKALDLTLTKRQEIPMAGVPFHSSDSYIDRLVDKGYRVAIAEQMEDPRSVKGLVKREIVRVITPGTVITSSLLSEKTNNFLACITQVGSIFGLSILDLTTAEFRVLEFEETKQLFDELCRLHPKELLLPEKMKRLQTTFLAEVQSQLELSISFKEDWHFEHRHTLDVLTRHFRVHNLDGFGLSGMTAAINAAGAILQYIQEDLNLSASHIQEIKREHLSGYMLLDRATQKHLELFEPLSDGKRGSTLLQHLDHTSTPMGARLLRQWLLHPLLNTSEIAYRQAGVAEWLAGENKTVLNHLREVRDLERLIMRIETGYASPRDVSGLRYSLEHIAPLSDIMRTCTAPILLEARAELTDLSTLAHKIASAIVDQPPLRLSDGQIFKRGYHPELDELMSLKEDSHAWMAKYQTRLKETTQIKTLKVGYTKAFGFYIEVSRGQSDRIPADFQRRQTLVNAERFITTELKEYEHRVLHAEERASALEYALFTALRQEIATHAAAIRKIAAAVARIDCLLSLAQVARAYRYTCPLVDNTDLFHIQEGRHPVIEAALQEETFIPNDVHLDADKQRLLLITGPNMAGKSTFIRQVALIAILAQMGSFVPAKSAHLGIIDRVFSRIGASDDLSRGQSTFMVEMTETASILHSATDRSLVILDEIGRGTSTYDGISIAWAVAEYLLTQPGKRAKTLFATHYWELTELENQIPGAVNFNVAVHESERGIVFLHKIVRGGTDKSYGIHVGRLAGLPQPVLRRAQEMLAKLEKTAGRTNLKTPKQAQLSLFTPPPENHVLDALKSELAALDPNTLTPLEALRRIAEWKTLYGI